MRRHRLFLVPTRADVPVDEAIAHWTARHGAIFAATPELDGYVQHQPSAADQRRLGGRVCAEAWFTDRDAEARAFASQHYRTLVTTDEARFVDRSRAWTALVREESTVGPAPVTGAGVVEVVAFGVDGDALPTGTSARVLSLDRSVPGDCGQTVVIATVADEPSARALTDALSATVVFLARRADVKPPAGGGLTER